MGGSFWQKDGLITHILSELWLITHTILVRNLLTHTLCTAKLNYDFYYRASENTTSASRGRLNNADSAWCFHYEKFVGQKAFFTVDLGAIHLISGFQSQGPPQKLHPKEYLRYVGLDIELSLDGISWEHTVHDNGAKMSVSNFQLYLCTQFITCQ